VTLEILEPVEITFQEADKADQRLDEFLVRDRLARILSDLGKFTPEQRRGNFALVAALEFQPRRMYGEPIWDMYWQPMGSATDKAGKYHYFPDVADVDSEIIEQWSARAQTTRHPLLRARYADLAWEVTYYRRKELERRPDVAMPRTAIDGYLDATEATLFIDDIYAWNYVERAIELAASIRDQGRLQRAKAMLFKFRAACESRDPRYAFWRFHEIAWSHARVLGLTDTERAEIVHVLESQLDLRSRIENPQTFDPHLARTAADALRLWRGFAGDKAAADRAALKAGEAFEAAASQANGLIAITWLSEQLTRYRQLGNHEAVARVEQAIRDRSGDAQGEMKRISVPLNVTREELETWADRVAGDNLEDGLRGFAAIGLVGRNSTERTVLNTESHAPVLAHIPIAITGRDGFTKATIGSVKDDLDGRTVYQAAQLISQGAPWLNLAWQRIQAKHSANLENLLEWLSQCPYFPADRLRFVREGLAAWLTGDMLKALHILVPQVEAGLRDVLASLGGVVTRPDFHGGTQMISLGDVLSHERFVQAVPDDIRFHLQVLYQDSRGLNFRNELAHGIAAFELFGLGMANIVVHSVILIGTFRVHTTASPPAQQPPATTT
jgi:hypothetical protein